MHEGPEPYNWWVSGGAVIVAIVCAYLAWRWGKR